MISVDVLGSFVEASFAKVLVPCRCVHLDVGCHAVVIARRQCLHKQPASAAAFQLLARRLLIQVARSHAQVPRGQPLALAARYARGRPHIPKARAKTQQLGGISG